ncbi:MAG: carbohydrate binding domain-containing protein [Lachnospiraceae bacterium]|nr:carbohydrate binding domain-containing protein [Lachnospiraceae bacterium]MDD7327121.1 carbohydrate binding domain-containing protein [Lachnospiraceae bacterium]MDY2759850.1 carbohydrate binding domain-containing protein [Lachnospiraceae bacterium]
MGKNSRFTRACAAALTFSLAAGSIGIAPAVYAGAAETEEAQIADKYSKEGYHLAWHDEFNGSSLNTKDWNVEAHEPGWVNSELQSYVDEAHVSDAVTLSDGILKIQPTAKAKDASKTDDVSDYDFTSGRINTQGKHDFTYGRFEARVKVPTGKGYLPAFWLMASNEGLYGQWPKCGEIDIAEVMGQETNKSYHTVHYGYDNGSGHKQNQGTDVLTDKSFADSYHVFALDWEPGKLTWYVDDKPVYTTSDWYTGTDDNNQITYPAPFDQNFYVILNLAVGGSWVTNPDMAAVKDMSNQSYDIDYVRVYQKDKKTYAKEEAKAKKPVKEVTFRKADANGSYVLNGDFSKDIATDESATDNWVFHTESDAAGSKAEVSGNSVKITPAAEGSVAYSTQLKQSGVPMYRGWKYQLSFDAVADEKRNIIVDIEGPDNGWTRYLADTTQEIGTEKKTYTLDFTMDSKTDANGCLEFNLGNQGSTAPVTISNVKLTHVSGDEIPEKTEKTVRPDGNYVYNGSFDQGSKRLGYWTVSNKGKAKVSVTNDNLVRRLKIVVPKGSKKSVTVKQTGLSPIAKGNYAVSFDASAAKNTKKALTVNVAGKKINVNLKKAKNLKKYSYTVKISKNKNRKNSSISFQFKKPGTYYLDNVSIVEDALIKNSSFNGGLAGYTTGSYASSDATFGVDSIQAGNDNALDCDIRNTGDADWNVQVKQYGVKLVKGKKYKLTFDARSTRDRQISVVMQRDGTSDNNWDVYSGDNNIDVTSEWKTYEKTFTMNSDTDSNAMLSISLGAIAGNQITDEHHVYLDNFSLAEVK